MSVGWLVEEEGSNDDVNDGDVAVAADDGFSFDIAQSEALASHRTLIHVGTFRMRNSTESSTEYTSAN